MTVDIGGYFLLFLVQRLSQSHHKILDHFLKENVQCGQALNL